MWLSQLCFYVNAAVCGHFSLKLKVWLRGSQSSILTFLIWHQLIARLTFSEKHKLEYAVHHFLFASIQNG